MTAAARIAFMTGVAAALAGPLHAEEPLGRLFFTPEQRSALDAGKKIAVAKGAGPATAPVRRPLDLAGVVVRSDGERTIWVNGKAYHDTSPEGVQVKTDPRTPAAARVSIPGTDRAARVKVGQQLDLVSGKVRQSASRQPQADTAAVSAQKPSPRPVRARKSKAAEEPASTIGEDQTDSSPPAQ